MVAALVLFGASCASGAFLYKNWQLAAKAQVRDSLSRVASAAAALVDSDLQVSFTSPEQEQTPEYARAIEPLRRLQLGDSNIAFVYTFVLKDGKVRFVLDPTPEGDADGDGVDDKSHIMEVYDHATPEMMAALITQQSSCDSEPSTDPWGTFLSAYAPILTKTGEYCGSVGIDLRADTYVNELWWLRKAALDGAGLALAISLIVGLVVWRLRLRSANDAKALRRLVADLSVARDAAEESSRLKTEFLATMSHEFRTPLNGIIGMNELLLESPLDANQRDMFETVQGSASALLVIVNDILDLSRIDTGHMYLDDADFDPRALIREVAAEGAQQAQIKNLQLLCSFDPPVLPRVRGDANRIRQALHNLVFNAVKFTERGKVIIHVCMSEAAESRFRLRCEVRDTGIGIAPRAMGLLFECFSQLDGSYQRKYGGTGLGLAISKRVIELMGGEIGVSSELGVGSTFWFEVPLQRAGGASSSEAPAPAAASQAFDSPSPALPHKSVPVSGVVAPPPANEGRSVLLVEDNPVNQKVMLMMLATLGCRTKAVWNGQGALDALDQAGYDLVLMDCQMPEMDGFATTIAIRQREAGHRHTHIVALTANAMPGDREKCIAAGMDDYLGKPVSKSELQRVIAGSRDEIPAAVPCAAD